MPIPKELATDHVLRAIARLDAGETTDCKAAVHYALSYNGKSYAPKAVISLAAEEATGTRLHPSEFSGGNGAGQANYVLRNLGFTVIRKYGAGSSQRFKVGSEYTRQDIYDILVVPDDKQGGDWDTGYHKHDDRWYIFAALGTKGRTGHDYQNHWRGNTLVWHGRTGSKIDHPSIQSMTSGDLPVFIFTRDADRSPFVFEGLGYPSEVLDTVPVTVHWEFDSPEELHPERLPEEIPVSEAFLEGAASKITVNSYERNPAARRACIAHYGYDCAVCGFNFGDFYGAIGEEFIHVHHLRSISSIGEEYEVDPIEDLRPVCPNCHAMLHRERPALSIENLKELIEQAP